MERVAPIPKTVSPFIKFFPKLNRKLDIDPHAGHEVTSVREFTHAGHVVRIITTYHLELDGHPIRAHLSVDEDGQVYIHATPFVTYASATDLMKTVIDAYPESFSASDVDQERPHHGHSHPDA